MTPRVACASVLRGLVLLVVVQVALSRPAMGSPEPFQGGGTTKGDGTTGSIRSGKKTIQPNPNRPLGRPNLFVSGSVAMTNGSPLPSGAVIECNCNGRRTREAFVDPTGHFSFEFGSNPKIFQDASSNLAWAFPGNEETAQSGYYARLGSVQAGCELSAQLGGFRSSVVSLNATQMMGNIDVGTIVLAPVTAVVGTTVSLNDLQATRRARDSLGRADKAARKRQWSQAEELLKIALSDYPQYATAWLRLGQVYQATCFPDDARAAFASAIREDPRFVLPYLELARLAAAEGAWEEALDLTNHAIALDPIDYPLAFYLNSLANLKLQRLDEAASSARSAQQLDNHHQFPQSHLLLARIFRQKEDPMGEAAQLREYLKYSPAAFEVEMITERLLRLDASRGR